MYVESEKIGIDDLIYKSTNRDTDLENKNGHQERERGGGMDWDWHVYTMYKTGNYWEPTVGTGNSTESSVVT